MNATQEDVGPAWTDKDEIERLLNMTRKSPTPAMGGTAGRLRETCTSFAYTPCGYSEYDANAPALRRT